MQFRDCVLPWVLLGKDFSMFLWYETGTLVVAHSRKEILCLISIGKL